MIKAPKNREEYLVRCVDLQSIKPSSEYWAKRVQDDLEKLRNDNLQLIEQIGGGE